MAKKQAPKLAAEIDFGFEKDTDFEIPVVSSGSIITDYLLGGGYGRGRFAEIFGNYSCGKSYELYQALIANQKAGGTSVLFEQEGAFNRNFFQMLGGDPNSLQVQSNLDTVEQVFECMKRVAKGAAGRPDIPVCLGWDGIAATSTDHITEVGMSKRDMSKAILMDQGTKLLRNEIKRSKVCVIATNQIRVKIGQYATGHTTPGGSAYTFICSQRVELTLDGGDKTSLIYDNNDKSGEPIGRWIRFKVEKNKLGSAMGICKRPFYNHFGRKHPLYGYETSIGFDENESLFEFYASGTFRLPPKDPNTPPWEGPKVLIPNGAWYKLTDRIDKEQKAFYAKDWMEKLEQFPILKTLPLENLSEL